jgi:hypothetical protein
MALRLEAVGNGQSTLRLEELARDSIPALSDPSLGRSW